MHSKVATGLAKMTSRHLPLEVGTAIPFWVVYAFLLELQGQK